MKSNVAKPLVGLAAVLVIVAVGVVAVGLFRGSFTTTVPLTVITSRAGLVMNPDAKVKLNGAQVGTVSSIEPLTGGRAALHLAIRPEDLALIPANADVQITSSTVFGAKNVEFRTAAPPSRQSLTAGQVLDGDQVTVEINTVFQQLVSVLSKVEPIHLNETLNAFAAGTSGRGAAFGRTLSDLEELLARFDPSLDNLSQAIAVAPQVLGAYADVAPEFLDGLDSVTRISETIVDTRQDLDRILLSAIGLAQVGNEVIATNGQPLADALGLIAPTTALTARYQQALNCGLAGLVPLAKAPPGPVPGVLLSQSFFLGVERYRYPENLPKVAATGGPQCVGLPRVGFGQTSPMVITDTGANPAQYGNQGILLNADGLKQMLFGPISGPPRNSVQMGQPG